MNIPYRTRRTLQRAGTAALILLIVFILIWLCWVVWLERYVVYTQDGARIDFDLPRDLPAGEVALPPSDESDISVYFNEGDNSVETSNELTQLSGYYIDTAALATNITGIMETVEALPSGTPVMIDVKSIKGYFYYSSEVADAEYANVDVNLVDSLIKTLTTGKYYAIARIPAFRDYYFGLNNVSCGLPLPGGYLWMDNDGCYWLDPTDSGTLNYIISIVEELKRLGFDEVVLDDFRFPTTDSIVFDGDKNEALTSAMDTLMSNCATNSSFTLSFTVSSASFALPDSRCRLYLEDVEAGNVGAVAAQATITNPEARLVFMATTNDTRYDAYGVLRPLDAATIQGS